MISKEDISASIFPLCPRAQGERRPVVGGPQLRRGGGGEVEEAAKKQRLAVAAACAARAALHAATCSGVTAAVFAAGRGGGACPLSGQRSHPFNRECTQFRTSFLPKSRSVLFFCKASCFSAAAANTESPCGSDALNWPLNGCSERVGALHLALSESTLSFLQLLLLLKDEIA